MITIPTAVNDAWDDLLKKGLSSDKYTYLVFDVKEVASDPKKKVQVLVKVFVPDSLRSTATTNIADAMRNEGHIVDQKEVRSTKISEIDIHASEVGNKIQVIRVQVKPVNSSGSGGGAKQTTIQESTSCLYNALRFYVINEKLTAANVTEVEHLKKAFEYINTPDVTLDQMILFSSDPDWKEVFIDGANKLYDKVKSLSSSINDYIFVRGDTTYDDGLIKGAFNMCKSSVDKHLQNEDKWNPSDIWMYSKGAEKQIKDALTPYGVKKTAGTIALLNEELKKLFNAGVLIGVSLKKTGASGTIKVVNNDSTADRRRTLAVGFEKGISINELVYDSKRNYTGEHYHKRWPMDVYIQYGKGPKDNIQLRNFGGDKKGDWKLELKSQYAAMGKIQGSVARTILEKTGFTNVPDEPKWEHCDPGTATKTQKKEITEEIYNLLTKYTAKGLDVQDQEGMIDDIDIKKQSWRYSKLSGLRFLDFLCQPGVEADKAVKELYLFGGSQADHSSVYLKYS